MTYIIKLFIYKMTEEKNTTKGLKFYSQKAISIATFIGGPMAAGYLVRSNYLSLNKPDEANKSLIIGIISTILLFVVIFMIPEEVIDKVPAFVIPAIYTGIIYYIVEKIQGPTLNKHEQYENAFHSRWKAAGIGFISLIILVIGMFAYVFFLVSTEEYDAYYIEMEKFDKNETEALEFYNLLDRDATDDALLQELETTSIPKWKENIEIIKNSNTIENLPSELLSQNEVLLTYSTLRLEAFELLKKTIREDTDEYYLRIEEINTEIDIELDKLN